MSYRRYLLIIIKGICIGIIFTSASCFSKEFKLYHWLLFKNTPDLDPYGITSIHLIGGDLWIKGKNLNSKKVADHICSVASAAQKKNRITVLDVEHWPLTGTDAVVRDTRQKLLTLLGIFRKCAPSLKIGYYGVPPVRDYWRAMKGKQSPAYRKWQADNDKYQELANRVDILFPSLYAFYEDRNGWLKYAEANIKEARRLAKGKPIYVFLWPQFHESNAKMKGKFIPGYYWRLQLETAKRLADGAVLWGGWQTKWVESADWWRVTKEFLGKRH
ncbi:hypothetical protein [Methylocaldum sp.]|uniref:hypothetical protein n=1 Tax=Methylocaldum sp. TaxID=1969727 RepID=UPI002D33D063|nr:hypothetical protein [Methylocaldum sp.]HYE37381.1 hypothetical protein [Methylocaldum sp.]